MKNLKILVTGSDSGLGRYLHKNIPNSIGLNRLNRKEILKDKSYLSNLNKWDIAIFRGGQKGILHRTPESAVKGNSSILMRLDDKSFYKDINRINNLKN